MGRWGAPAKAAAIAVVLAFGAFIWLVNWHGFYRGVAVSSTPASSADPSKPPESKQVNLSIVQVNGLKIVPVLLFPVMLTVVGLLITVWTDVSHAANRVLLWSNAIVLAAFCVVALLTVGMFYLPAAAGLLASGTLALRRPAS